MHQSGRQSRELHHHVRRSRSSAARSILELTVGASPESARDYYLTERVVVLHCQVTECVGSKANPAMSVDAWNNQTIRMQLDDLLAVPSRPFRSAVTLPPRSYNLKVVEATGVHAARVTLMRRPSTS